MNSDDKFRLPNRCGGLTVLINRLLTPLDVTPLASAKRVTWIDLQAKE